MSASDSTPAHPSFDSFERAFRGGCAGCSKVCECGKTYYNPNGSWDWEPSELERLAASPTAFARDYAIGVVEFEGRYYADACDCWHPRALKLIGFLNAHAQAIADYLSEEKARKRHEADRAPVVA